MSEEAAKTGPKGREDGPGEHGHAERHRRMLQGEVVSDKMDKTIVVQVQRRYRHPRYRKYVNEQVRYKAHDENNEAKIGDKVRIVESRPLSRDKRWRLLNVVERAQVL